MLGVDVIDIHGGLGNQMFEYALFLNLKKRHPWRLFLFDNRYSKGVHQGYELPKLFKVKTTWRTKGFSAMRRLFSKGIESMPIFEETSPFRYEEGVWSQNAGTYYEGCWQSEKYFAGIEKQIREVFTFDERMLNTRTAALSNQIASGGTYASIHVRRGDYVKEGRNLCSKEYYEDSICQLQKEDLEMRFVVFSDDIEWVRDSIDIPNAIYVDWNHKEDSWQDMYLMSRCHHNIVANSTFSWWGAWLNANPNKIVVAPYMWLNEPTKELDIIPETWRIAKK